MIFERLNFLCEQGLGGRVLDDGCRYIYNTYEEWRLEHFPFFSERLIQRAFIALEKAGLIISQQPDGHKSRRKYYRISGSADDLLEELWQEVRELMEYSAIEDGAEEIAMPPMVPIRHDGMVPNRHVPICTDGTADSTFTSLNPSAEDIPDFLKSDLPEPLEAVAATPAAGGGKKSSARRTKAEMGYSAEFLEFWAAYPRRVGKPQAAQAFRQCDPKLVMQTLARDLAAGRFNNEERYLKHPSTWLRSRPWEDEPSGIRAAPSSPPAPTKAHGPAFAKALAIATGEATI